ncbi:MAG: 6-bladed beta-propeller [Magnetococcales bacterium]|nr:6-bladed beta-propeller [Magnetococcales bacterium]
MVRQPPSALSSLPRLVLLFGLLAAAGCVTTPEPVEKLAPLVFPGPPDPARFVFERTIRGTVDVQPRDEESSFGLEEMVTGASGPIGEGFGKPFGIKVFQGRIYVGDTVNRHVMMLDPAHGSFKEVGAEAPGDLVKPLGMDMDGQGNLYVMDATKKWILVYDRDGNYLRGIGGPSFFDRPSGVAVNPEGSLVFAVDTGSSQGKPEFHRIRVFDAKNGKLLYDIGKRGNGDGEFNLARDATIGSDGLLYVVDGGNFRVQVFDQKGKFIRKFGEVGRRLGQFARPKGIDTDKEGNLYISDASHANFQIFTPDGDLLMFIGTRGKETDRASYLLPGMIAVDEDGRVYLVDQGYRKVDVFRPAALKESEGALGRAFEALKMLKQSDDEENGGVPEESPPKKADSKKKEGAKDKEKKGGKK